jgi:Tfp pilus assembly protein PilO
MRPLFLLAGIGVAIAVLIGYNAIYVPHQAQVRLTHNQIAEEQASQQMQAEVAALLGQVERSRKRLPEEPDPSVLVHDVATLAQQAGVQLTSITREPPEELPPFTHLTVRLQGTASYHQLGVFLDALERADRFLRVERLDVGESKGRGPATIQMVVGTFFVPPLLPGAGTGIN